VYHIGGGTLSKDNPRKIFLNFRNNLIMLYKNLSFAEAAWIIPARFALDAISAWKNLLSGQPSFFTAIMKSHFAFMGWVLKSRKSAIYPVVSQIKPKGVYKGSVVWQHFVRGKSKFLEIIQVEN
jgi:hypothetical protein